MRPSVHPKIGKFTCFIFTLIAKNRLLFPLCFIVWDFRKKLQYKFPNLRGRGGGGQRSLETFPKIHPFWYPDPYKANVVIIGKQNSF